MKSSSKECAMPSSNFPKLMKLINAGSTADNTVILMTKQKTGIVVDVSNVPGTPTYKIGDVSEAWSNPTCMVDYHGSVTIES